jgi:hypothetical protein
MTDELEAGITNRRNTPIAKALMVKKKTSASTSGGNDGTTARTI